MVDAVEDMSTLTRTLLEKRLLGRMHWNACVRNAEIKHGISERLWRWGVELLPGPFCNLEPRTQYHGLTRSRLKLMAARPEISGKSNENDRIQLPAGAVLIANV